MKFFTNKRTLQKILVTVIIILLMNFTLAPYHVVYAADDGWSISGTIAKEIFSFFTWLCDLIMGGLNQFMLGANGYGSAMLSQNDPNLTSSNSWIYIDSEQVNQNSARTIKFDDGEIDTDIFKFGDAHYSIPNMIYSPENIFANNIAALDINFLRPNEYQSIYAGGRADFQESANEKATSATQTLKTTIASWYKSFRNISIVGLLSVLIYLGIRVLISSTASDKAKYKESLKDWVVALCMVFFIHFIMSAVLMVSEKCTELFSTSVNQGYTVVMEGEKKSDGSQMAFRTNLMGLMRFSAQNRSAKTAAVYSIMYWALVIYTCMFTIVYLKRFLYMAFFTMIAPLVSLTYPIDKVGDGKSQAFNMWFKEYTMNAVIQPVHLIVYTVFVGSAYELAAKNPLYAIVALGFILPAEKFVKKMFGLDKAESNSGLGTFAGGALAMSAVKAMGNLGKGKKKKGEGKSDDDKGLGTGIFMPSNTSGDLHTFTGEPIGGQEKERQSMLEVDDEKFGTNEWDPQQRDALARENNQNDGGMQYNDNDYGQILRDSGYDDAAINEMMGQGQANNLERMNSDDMKLLNEVPRPENQNANKKSQIAKKATVLGAVGRVAGRGISKAGSQVWRSKGKIAKGAARFAVRTGFRAAGIAAGTALGVAAGITTGDGAKAAQFAVAGGLAGNSLGGNTYDRIESPIVRTARNARTAYEEERFGITGAKQKQRERQNKRARDEFMHNDKQIRNYKELAEKMDYKGNIKDLMSAAADYKEAGVTDDKLIQNALKAEYKRDGEVRGNNHQQFVDVAAFAHENNFGKSYIEDEKNRKTLENVISATPSIANNIEAQRETGQKFAELFDRGDLYKKVGTLGKPVAGVPNPDLASKTKEKPKKSGGKK